MTALTEMADLTVEDGIAVITIDNPPVNALSQGVRQGIKDGLEFQISPNYQRYRDAILAYSGGKLPKYGPQPVKVCRGFVAK